MGGLVSLCGLEGGMEEEFYGVGGGGKWRWEIMMQEYMNTCMCEGKKVQRWTLVGSDTHIQYSTYST